MLILIDYLLGVIKLALGDIKQVVLYYDIVCFLFFISLKGDLISIESSLFLICLFYFSLETNLNLCVKDADCKELSFGL